MDYLGRLNHSRRQDRALPSLRRLAVFVTGLLVLSIAAGPALAQRKKVERVAVLTFKSIGAPKEMGEAVAEILRTELVDVGGFELVERGQIEALLKEQKLQLQDVIDEKTAVRIGRLSGAKLVVIGSIVKLGTTFTLNSRFIDVQTGITRIGKNIRGNSVNEIPNMCRQLAYVIADRTYVEKLPPQPRTPRKPVVRAPKPTPRKPQLALRPYAAFKTARVERDVTVSGRRGIRVHGKFTINNFVGRKGRFSAFFRFKGQSGWIKALPTPGSSIYKRPNGSATIQQAFTPKYKNTTFPNFKLFIPYDELNLARGWHNLVAVLEIQDDRAKDLTSKKVDFRVNITRTGGAQRARGSVAGLVEKKATAAIKRVWLAYNQYQAKKKGMWIHTNFLIKNHKGRRGRFTVFFRYEGQKSWLYARKSATNQYKTRSGYITVQETFTPKFKSTRFADFKIFMPNIEFNRDKGKHKLEAVVQIHDANGKNLKQRSVRFTYTR
jgi:hypothetical protein